MAVESIKTYTVTLGATDLTGSTTMDGQTTANCVPIITNRITTPDGNTFDEYRVKATFSGGDVVITRGVATTAAITCVVSVWEFDGSGVVVDSGTFSMTDPATTDVVTSGVTAGLTTTFLVSYHSCVNVSGTYDSPTVRGRITGTNELTFDRESGTGDISGQWYTARATAGFFAVQQAEIAIATGATATVALDSAGVSPSKTFLVGSHAQGSGDDNDDSTYDITLTQTTNPGDTVTLTRNKSVASIGWWGGCVVTLTGSETVYHGTINPTDGDDTASIGGTVVTGNSSVFTCGNSGGQNHGAFDGSASTDVPCSQVTWEFASTTQVQCKHYVATSTGAVTFNVVEWDVGGAPPATRRIMVIS